MCAHTRVVLTDDCWLMFRFVFVCFCCFIWAIFIFINVEYFELLLCIFVHFILVVVSLMVVQEVRLIA